MVEITVKIKIDEKSTKADISKELQLLIEALKRLHK